MLGVFGLWMVRSMKAEGPCLCATRYKSQLHFSIWVTLYDRFRVN